MTITGEPEELVALRLRVQALRRCLGVHLATFRHTSGLSQRQLAQRLECSPSLIARVEKGERPMSANRWVIADEVCAANGALIDEHCGLVEVEREYLGELRLRREVSRHRTALARLGAQTPPAGLPVAPAARAGSVQVDDTGDDRWWDGVLEDIGEELAQEMRVVIEKLEQAVGRRRALQVLSLLLATAKLSDLDTDEQTRRVRAVDEPDRVDAQVVRHLAATLAHYRRLDDTLGPCAVLDGVLVQHELVHHLLPRTSEQWYKYLRILDSGMAAAIGNYLLNMDAPAAARGWFVHARKAGHAGESPAHAAYAAALLSNVARLAGDTPAALDAAAAARSLAARSRDPQVKALAEQYAAGAYALDGHYDACLTAVARAHDFLTTVTTPVPDSPAYWIGHPNIDGHLSTHFVLLDRPRQAVAAATTALAHFDRTNSRYGWCQVRLGRALVLAGRFPRRSGCSARPSHTLTCTPG